MQHYLDALVNDYVLTIKSIVPPSLPASSIDAINFAKRVTLNPRRAPDERRRGSEEAE